MLIASALLWALALPFFAASAYLGVATAISLCPRRAPPRGQSRLRFDVIVPAHNEERSIAQTVSGLFGLEWPADARRIVVVADNCSDATAAAACAAGALVWERSEPARFGKGFALEFAFARSLKEGFADALVVVDADTRVAPDLLRVFAAHLEGGAAAVQADYRVRNPHDSWRTWLMAIAFGAFHGVRSMARERLGLSTGLRGNGMCFSAALMRAVPHGAHSIVEDVEYGIALGRVGYRVAYAHDARVFGEMVSAERASRSQRRRWEAGRRAVARKWVGPLLREALHRRSAVLADLAVDLLLPPLGWIAAGVALGWVCSVGVAAAGGGARAAFAYTLAAFSLAAYVLRGWWLSETGARGLLHLALAPAYVGWKIALSLRRVRALQREWVRTARSGEAPP